MKTYYFDYNATTPLAPEVRAAMDPFLGESFGNPSSLHQMGRHAAKAIRTARRQVALLLGAGDENEILFTSGGTESNNTAVRAALSLSGDRKEIVTSTVEHSSVRQLCRQLVREGYMVREIPVDHEGRLDLEELSHSLSDRTAVVSLMFANNETGVLFPIREIADRIKDKKPHIFFHVDAVQAVGKCPFLLKDLPIDFLSLSAHKLYGPKGAGALYIRRGVPFRSLIFGGSQERGRRAGTENVGGIVGLGAACERVQQDLDQERGRLTKLRDEFEQKLLLQLGDVSVHARHSERLCNTSHVSFGGIEAEPLLIALDQKGIFASSGSACMSGAHEPSYVLKAMGLSDEEANAAIRLSFGRFTTPSDVEVLVCHLIELVSRLRNQDEADCSQSSEVKKHGQGPSGPYPKPAMRF